MATVDEFLDDKAAADWRPVTRVLRAIDGAKAREGRLKGHAGSQGAAKGAVSSASSASSGGAGATGSPLAAPPRGVTVLSSFLDLRAAVNLAHELDAGLSPKERGDLGKGGMKHEAASVALNPGIDANAVETTLNRLRDEVLDLDGRLRKACLDLLEGRTSVLSPTRVIAALTDAGLLDDGAPASMTEVNYVRGARIIGGVVIDYLAVRLERARGALRILRAEMGPELRRFSRAAARLEALDAHLNGVISEKAAPLTDRLLPMAESAFVSAIREAMERFVASPPPLKNASLSAAVSNDIPLSDAEERDQTTVPDEDSESSNNEMDPEVLASDSEGGAEPVPDLKPVVDASVVNDWTRPGGPLHRATLLLSRAALSVFRHDRLLVDALLEGVERMGKGA